MWKLESEINNDFCYFIPNINQETLIAFMLITLGIFSVILIEKI